MKRIYRKFVKSKAPNYISPTNHAPGSTPEPATDSVSSVPASAAAASAQVIQGAGVTTAHDLRVSTSFSALAINDLAPVSVPASDVNTTHELQASASVSVLAVAPVAHPKESSPSSPDAIVHANLGSTKSEHNSSAQQSVLGLFANAQNILITGSTFQ
ncbi:hypothetical protein BYT27DRAFT_7219193 [Phlegmacium glaucopus]|nr:hypothetical protein BYT27DRAFT_7219193 [Phlegmacium glaucopus]